LGASAEEGKRGGRCVHVIGGRQCVLVAGGGGFIGGHLAKALTQHGFSVRAVDIKPLDQWF
jgi:NADPH-dependent 2,4-dienoyl-CoA reductase/sulfur reductase-like enzyme